MLPRSSKPDLPPSNPPSSSDDDGLNDSAATVERPAPFAPAPKKGAPPKALMDTGATIPRPTPIPKRAPSAPPPPEANPFAKFENDDVRDDEGSLPTEALIRPDVKLAEAGIAAGMSIEDLATPSGLKKPIVRKTPPPAMKDVDLPAPPPRKTPLPSTPPESAHTRVAPIQTPAPVQALPVQAYVAASGATTALQPGEMRARDIPPLATQPAQTRLAQPSHKIALIAAVVLLAAAMVLVFTRRAQQTAMAATPSSAFPAPPTPPVEVQVAPPPTVIAAVPAAVPAAPQAQPQAVANVKTRRHASRPNIPVHREQ